MKDLDQAANKVLNHRIGMNVSPQMRAGVKARLFPIIQRAEWAIDELREMYHEAAVR